MKKSLIISIISLFTLGNAATAQFAAGYTNTGNVLTFKLKPSVTTTTGFSVMEFFVIYPTGSPAFSYGPVTVNTADFPGMTGTGVLGSGSWEIEHNNAAYVIPGYNVDHIFYTAPAPSTTAKTYNMNQVYDVISVPLNGPSAVVNMEFVQQSDESSFYLALTSDIGGDLRESSFSNYFFPATATSAGPNSTTIYYAALAAVVPVKFSGFNVTKGNNSALINWSVENEDANTSNYEIERSLNGIDFSSVVSIAPKNNGKSANTYAFTQDNLSSILSSGAIYFRIKQTDKDGKAIYTEIKSVRLDGKSFGVTAYPNPAKTFTRLSIDLVKDSEIKISVVDATGKQIQNMQLQGFKGLNVKEIGLDKLASGNYMVKVQAGADVKSIPVTKVN